MGFDKTILTDHRDGAAKLETVSKAASIDRNARVWTLIMAKCWGRKLQGDTDMMRRILGTICLKRETDTHMKNVIKEYETYILRSLTGYILLIILMKFLRTNHIDLLL